MSCYALKGADVQPRKAILAYSYASVPLYHVAVTCWQPVNMQRRVAESCSVVAP